MRRWLYLTLAVIPVLLLADPVPAAADADTHFAHIAFGDKAGAVTLTIPVPACRKFGGHTACLWELFVNEPGEPGQPVIGAAFGTAGVLSVPYPTFCGVLQADALVGPPTRKEVGFRHLIRTCGCPAPLDLTSFVKPLSTPGLANIRPPSTPDPANLPLGLGLLVVAGVLGKRRTLVGRGR
jgi:hypothetical protein